MAPTVSQLRIRGGVVFALLALCMVARTSTNERAWITVLSTTDLHGNILPVDYYTGRPDARGLAKVASIVRQARTENPSGTLLLDSGDAIQGTPLEYVHNRIHNAPPDPMMSSMNALAFDAMTVGNHEYNFGLAVLEKAKSEARFPWLSANTYRRGTNETYHRPYIVKELNGVRVGVLGLTTPGIPFWENTQNYAGLDFREPVAEAKRWVEILKGRERVDLVIVAMHMGLEEDLATGEPAPGQVLNENRALAIARLVGGVDIVLTGHTHREIPGVYVNGVLIMQANLWGRHVARADVFLEKTGQGAWSVAAKQARTIPITESTAVDADIAKLAEPYDQETRAWLDRAIGESDAELTAENARFEDTALLDLVQRVQLDAGKADVSMVASFNPQARLPKGVVTVRDIAGLYVYENTLVVLEVTGQQLKEALEHSARFFRAFVPGRTRGELVDGRIPDYNFDIAEGVSYDLDVTRPFGQRVQNLRFRGQPLSPEQTLRLATNNYRVNGGGGYTMYKGAPEVYRSSQEIRELIVEWVEQHRRVPGAPTNNWRLIAVPR
ncbi:MAG: bifunctional UDP-sugar hydrolase/5'-nucleotidase [Acidobacteriota bacterium]